MNFAWSPPQLLHCATRARARWPSLQLPGCPQYFHWAMELIFKASSASLLTCTVQATLSIRFGWIFKLKATLLQLPLIRPITAINWFSELICQQWMEESMSQRCTQLATLQLGHTQHPPLRSASTTLLTVSRTTLTWPLTRAQFKHK